MPTLGLKKFNNNSLINCRSINYCITIICVILKNFTYYYLNQKLFLQLRDAKKLVFESAQSVHINIVSHYRHWKSNTGFIETPLLRSGKKQKYCSIHQDL